MKKHIFPSFCKALTVFAYSFIAAQFTYIQLVARNKAYTHFHSLIYTLIFVSAGYFLQAAVSFIFRFKRSKDTGLSIGKYISLPHLLLPVLIALGVGVAIALKRRAEMLAAYEIDIYSLAPLGYGFLIFALMLCGILIWFIPFGKLMTKQSLVPIALIYLGVFVFTPFIGIECHNFIAVGYLVYVAVALFLINQAALEKYFSSLGGVSASTRRYNAFIAIFLLCCILLTFFAVLGVMTGGFSLIKNAIASALRPNEEEYEPEDGYVIVGGNESPERSEFTLQPIPAKLQFILFLILFGLVAVFVFMRIVQFFLYRYSESESENVLMKILEALRNMILGFADLIRRFFGFKFAKYTESYVPMSYHEERISISGVSVREKSKTMVKSYSDFKARLDKLTDPAERYRFAYAVMMTLARSPYSLKASDTPREAAKFLIGKGWDDNIADQSKDYEFAAYSTEIPPADRLEDALGEICYRIRAML